jgi:hypothetical protein
MTRTATWLVIFFFSALVVRVAEASQAAAPVLPVSAASLAESLDLPFDFDGPPAPVPPAVIARDASGGATVRAVRLTAPLRIDGQLDEAVYATLLPVSDFIQIEPQEGSAATEKTEVWVTFDDAQVYVSFRCWESRPDRVVATEMRRDNSNIWLGDDIVAFIFDTFYDRRNSAFFSVNPIGGRQDAQVANEQQWNGSWNTIWDVRVGRFEGGWTVEAAIPFKSLRYQPGRGQIWGFNVIRVNRWKNEVSFLKPMPAAQGQRGINHSSLAATLVGLEAPPGSSNLEIKPYVISDLTSDASATPAISNDLGGDVGLDVKYGITQNLTADFTYNTDFAQVEADEQQVNLTRFSLFFPEKREFFLENQGTFSFGGASGSSGDTPILFYSRRIGLEQGRAVPLRAGGRLTGRVGRYSLGMLNIQTGDEPVSGSRPTNFSAVRVKRDILRRSSVGLIMTGRSVGALGAGSNEVYGVDGTLAFFDNLTINTYWARTHTDGRSGDDTSYSAQLDYVGDRYGVSLERLGVGSNFNPEVGFVRRDDMRRSFGAFRFSPRLPSTQTVRKLSWTASMAHIENGAGRLETREVEGEFAVEFENSDRFSVAYRDSYEFLPRPFRIAPEVTLPVAGYDFANVRVGYDLASHRALSGSVSAEHGTFFGGQKTAIGFSRGRLEMTPQLSVEPTLSFNWVDLSEGSFRTSLVGSRVIYTMTPLMFASALVQYNSAGNVVAANVRLRWEYRPGSELFVVYNEERDTLARGFPDFANRALIVKINRLLRF